MTGNPRKNTHSSDDNVSSSEDELSPTSAWLASSCHYGDPNNKGSSSSGNGTTGKKRGGKGKKKKKGNKSLRKGSADSVSVQEDGVTDSERSVTTMESIVHKSILKSDEKSSLISSKMKKKVSFDQVFVRQFARCIGHDAVPGDGSWPLGLTFEVVNEMGGDVDGFEKRRASELRNRATTIDSDHHLTDHSKLHLECDDKEDVTKVLPVLETRQFDYRRGQRNPLFKSLSEGKRQDLLLAALDPEHHHESHSKERKGHKNHQHGHNTRRVRGLSQADLDEMRNNASGVTVEMELDHEAMLLRNELESIRDHRSNVGCSCHKIKHINKLSERRLRDELRKRHLDTSGRKTELSERLKFAIDKEPCCSSNCPCAQEGINCQADLCSCWHGDKKHAMDPEIVAHCEERCGNQYGIYLYDADKIRQNRQVLLCSLASN